MDNPDKDTSDPVKAIMALADASPQAQDWIDFVITRWNEMDLPVERRLEESLHSLALARFPSPPAPLQTTAAAEIMALHDAAVEAVCHNVANCTLRPQRDAARQRLERAVDAALAGMPSREGIITQFGFMLWSVDHGFVGQLAQTEADADQTASYLSFPVTMVRVRVSTITLAAGMPLPAPPIIKGEGEQQ